MEEGEDDEAIMYLRSIFPKIKKKYGDLVQEIIFLQNPGETVFIPGGWWHVVVNLDDTIAITQNYCNSVNFPKVWKSVRKERKKMAVRLLKGLKENYPELYDKALEINKLDNFEMYDKDKFLSKKKMLNSERSDNRTYINTSYATSSNSSSSSSSSDSDD
jgi:histone arginine demethylase JMJD6